MSLHTRAAAASIARLLLAASACAFAAAPALAQAAAAAEPAEPPDVDRRDPATGWSIAAGLGHSRYRVATNADGSLGSTAVGHGGKVSLGYQFKRWLRVEVSAVTLGRDWKTDPQIAVVGAWRVVEPLAILTSVGRFHSRTPRDDAWFFSSTTTRDESRTVTTLGVGLEWYLRSGLSLTLQHESFDGFELFNTLSARYRF